MTNKNTRQMRVQNRLFIPLLTRDISLVAVFLTLSTTQSMLQLSRMPGGLETKKGTKRVICRRG